LYYLGAFGNDRRDEWSHFSGGAKILSKVGYNYASETGFDLAEAKVQWLHNTDPGYAASGDCLASPLYSDSISVSHELVEGPLGLTTEFLWGNGVQGRADACGLSAMATWSCIEKLQLVSILELAGSRDENGIVLPLRYEALAPGVGDKKGDSYVAGYAGLTYFVDGHRFKLMSGVKYSKLDGGGGGGDFEGWTWLAGVRMAF
jgi:phosphate-selective porin OprO/OprP